MTAVPKVCSVDPNGTVEKSRGFRKINENINKNILFYFTRKKSFIIYIFSILISNYHWQHSLFLQYSFFFSKNDLKIRINEELEKLGFRDGFTETHIIIKPPIKVNVSYDDDGFILYSVITDEHNIGSYLTWKVFLFCDRVAYCSCTWFADVLESLKWCDRWIPI